jgi:hypothetical protein
MHREADPAFHPSQALWSLSHLAYAAVRCRRVERTRELIERLLFPRLGITSRAQLIAMTFDLSDQKITIVKFEIRRIWNVPCRRVCRRVVS